MKRHSLMIALCLTLFCWKIAAQDGEDPFIRVLLAKEARGVLLEARGPYRVLHRGNHKVLSTGSSGKRFVSHAMSNGLRWGEEYPGIYAISIVPADSETTFFVDGMQYIGPIHVYATKKGYVNVVNDAPIEEFVRSTLSLKLSTPPSPEACAAMAIGARTNAYSQIYFRKDPHVLWDISAKEAGFLGMGVTMHNNGVDQAVDNTKFIVLEDRSGVPMTNISLSLQEAEKLAAKGLDAKRILRNSVSQGEIGMINAPRGKRAS